MHERSTQTHLLVKTVIHLLWVNIIIECFPSNSRMRTSCFCILILKDLTVGLVLNSKIFTN